LYISRANQIFMFEVVKKQVSHPERMAYL